jgi:hypothetical protein
MADQLNIPEPKIHIVVTADGCQMVIPVGPNTGITHVIPAATLNKIIQAYKEALQQQKQSGPPALMLPPGKRED